MRWTIGAAACVAMGLAGCGASAVSADTTAFKAGIAAYQKGDRAGLDAALQTLMVEAPAAAPCSAEAFAEARRAAMRQLLEPMAGATLSMSEEARFVFLAGAIGRGVEDAQSPAEACKGQEGVGLLAAQDVIQRGMVVQTLIGNTKAWREALVAQHGEQLNGRLKAAAQTLAANRFDIGEPSFAGIVE